MLASIVILGGRTNQLDCAKGNKAHSMFSGDWIAETAQIALRQPGWLSLNISRGEERRGDESSSGICCGGLYINVAAFFAVILHLLVWCQIKYVKRVNKYV